MNYDLKSYISVLLFNDPELNESQAPYKIMHIDPAQPGCSG